MVLNLVFSLLLRGPMGYKGLALALSLSVTVEAALLFLFLRPRMGGLEEAKLLWTALRSAAAAWIMVVVVAAVMLWMRHYAPLVDRRGVRYLAEVAVGIPLGAVAFFGVAWLTRSEEMQYLVARLRYNRQ